MMRHNQAGSRKHFNLLGITGMVLAVLLQASPGVAQYQRPQDARSTNRRGTTTAGTRGDGQLTQLTPKSHVGQSTHSHPTFSWFVAEGTVLPGEFQIYESREDGTYVGILETPHKFVSEPGFMAFTLPDSLPGLRPNTTYSWQLVLRNREFPNDIVVQTRSEIEIIETSEGNVSAQASTNVDQTQAEQTQANSAHPLPTEVAQLSQQGLWYDALTLISLLPAAESHTIRRNLLLELAEIELAEAEAMSTDAAIAVREAEGLFSHAQGLREIASLENEERLSSLLMRLH